MLQGPLDSPRLERIQIQWGGEAEVEMSLPLLEVDGTCGAADAIRVEALRRHPQLRRQVLHCCGRCGGQVIGSKPEIPQGAELEGKAQPSMGLPRLVNGLLIRLG